jgi:acetyl-CoA carboxylase biotin carboxyl carrier protein
MRVEEIRRLIKLVEESQINELEVRRLWTRVRILKKSDNHRGAEGTPIVVASPAPVAHPVAPAAKAPETTAAARSVPAVAPNTEIAEEAGTVAIRSPMVGTFYRAPSPTSPAYVDVNQHVEVGKVVCIVEAMKLMNEIESEVGGVIIRILVQNGQPVEFNQPLFLVRPD